MAKSKGRSTRRDSAAEDARPGPRPADGGTIVIGWIGSGSRPDRILVDFAGSPGGPVVARSTVVLDAGALGRAARDGQGAALAFEGGDLTRPVLLGLVVAPSASPLVDRAIEETQRAGGRSGEVEARLDGKRVVLEARDEIVLRCGDASIILRRDGKLMVKGAYVETRATGVNRIKGGAVKIN